MTMKIPVRPEPKQSLLFRIVTFFSKLRIRYLLQSFENPNIIVAIFVFISGSIALGILTIAAKMVHLPMLFPPLAPSAFIIFHTPMSVTASPRNVFLAHTLSLLAGIFSLWLVNQFLPENINFQLREFSTPHILAMGLAVGFSSILMVSLKCVHPPAAASALIASMGFFEQGSQMVGFVLAVVFLLIEAILFNRLFGGLPYPLWRANLQVSRQFGVLAGIPETNVSFWQGMSSKILRHPRPKKPK